MSLSLPSALGNVVSLDGCVSELVIDGADVELIENALDGVRVTECVLDMCTPETCLNNGVCEERFIERVTLKMLDDPLNEGIVIFVTVVEK